MNKEEPIKTGIDIIDERIEGFYPGELTVIQNSYGYLYLAKMIINIVRHSETLHIPFFLFLLGLLENDIIKLALGCTNDIFSFDIVKKELNDGLLELLLCDNMFVKSKTKLPLEDLCTHIKEKVSQNKNIDIIFIDDFYQISISENKEISETEDVLKTISSFKELAVQLNIPIVINCCWFHDANKTPVEELSRMIEAYADIIIDTQRDSGSRYSPAAITVCRNHKETPINYPLIYDRIKEDLFEPNITQSELEKI